VRPCDSAYDRRQGEAVASLIAALRASGRDVTTVCTGAVTIDGLRLTGADFDQLAVAWDGTAAGLAELLDEVAERARLAEAAGAEEA
jgi:putative intracellular protease/amidase